MDCEVMDRDVQDSGSSDIIVYRLARRVLIAFVLTLLTACMLVRLMMSEVTV